MDLLDNIKEIPLTQGKVAIVDAEDFDSLSRYNWHFCNGYAARREWEPMVNGKRKSKFIYMHRVLNSTPDGYSTDHENRNKLDNRKSNLRSASQSQNNANQKIRKDNSTGFRGVYFHKQRNKFHSEITINGNKKSLGLFDDPKEAALAYNKAAKSIFMDFANPNIIGGK